MFFEAHQCDLLAGPRLSQRRMVGSLICMVIVFPAQCGPSRVQIVSMSVSHECPLFLQSGKSYKSQSCRFPVGNSCTSRCPGLCWRESLPLAKDTQIVNKALSDREHALKRMPVAVWQSNSYKSVVER
eukprot:s1266_g13.t1